jgi:DNA-binding response OmpR family regulator
MPRSATATEGDPKPRSRPALGSDADVRRTLEAGFDGHLVKPIDYETIAAQLERIFWAHRGRNDPPK